MSLTFEPISLDRRDEYLKRFAQCPQKASDYSFANIWGWADNYGLEWAWGDQCVWIRQTVPDVLNWAPVGPWDTLPWEKCPSLHEQLTLTRVPHTFAALLKQRLGKRLAITKARGHWDYLYSVEELATLKGNRFHKKKNLFNQFVKKYGYVYHSLDTDCIEAALRMQEEWCEWRECDDSYALLAENQAIFRVLQDYDRIPGLTGGALYVDGEMVAYTVAEELTPDTLVIHFEKGKTNYSGIYQAINRLFLENQGQGYDFVNREQDLDDAGLRKAKLSYNPLTFLKKYDIQVLA